MRKNTKIIPNLSYFSFFYPAFFFPTRRKCFISWSKSEFPPAPILQNKKITYYTVQNHQYFIIYLDTHESTWHFPGGAVVKNVPAKCRRCRRLGFDPWVGTIPDSRKWQPTPVFLSGKSLGQRSLAGYCLWGHKESDVTEHAYTQHEYTYFKSVY